jgi:hypothetical protein
LGEVLPREKSFERNGSRREELQKSFVEEEELEIFFSSFFFWQELVEI